MKFVFVVNPIAGNDNQKRIFDRIRRVFRYLDDEMIIEETKFPGNAKGIAEHYAKEYKDECIVVACGGDGTVHEVANALAGTETPMMVLPLGTGNDFAKKLYDTRKIDVEQIIEDFGFYNGKVEYDLKPIDVIDYNGEKCVNVMSFGLDTKVVVYAKKMADKMPALGHNAYTMAILPAIAQPLHYNISYDLTCVTMGGREYHIKENNKDYALFAICNASYYGGGYCPAPDSKLDDGILDYCMIDGTNVATAIPLIPKYSAGELDESNGKGIVHTGYIKSGKIWMEDGSKLLGNCDGELLDCSELNFKVEEKALKLCFLK